MNGRNAECSGHDDNLQYRRTYGGLVLLLQVLSDCASTTLQELSLGSRIHACKDGAVPHWFLLSDTNIDTLHCFPSVFYNLRKFELSVSILGQVELLPSIAPSIQPQPKHFEGGDLARLLSLAENLEEIKLMGDQKAAKLCMTNTLGVHIWRRLRVLYLQWFEASASELEDFLKRHAISLQRMTLDEFRLTSGSWREVGANVTTITPALELILGLVSCPNRLVGIERYLPLASHKYLDISGPNQSWYDKAKRDDDGESQVEDEDYDEDEDESEDGSDTGELEYSSDDSSSETEDPRRKLGIDLLKTMDAALQAQVQHLRSELPGCPVQECLSALGETKNLSAARTLLTQWFGYAELDTIDPAARASVVHLMEDMPFECSALECKHALRSSDGDHHGARDLLQLLYGHR